MNKKQVLNVPALPAGKSSPLLQAFGLSLSLHQSSPLPISAKAKTSDPSPGGHGSKVERVFIIDIISYDWNCPQYITPRYTAAEVEQAIAPLKQRIAELEAKLESDQD